MKNLELFQTATQDNKSLTLIQINTDGNDYPRGLGSYGAIGFNTIEQAEEFARENGGEVSKFKTRAGHHFWRLIGWTNEAFSIDAWLEDAGDNTYMTILSDEFERFAEVAKDYANNEDFDGITKAYNRLENAKDAIDALEDDEVLVWNGSYFESKNEKMMEYSYDVYSYAVGVVFNPEIHEEK